MKKFQNQRTKMKENSEKRTRFWKENLNPLPGKPCPLFNDEDDSLHLSSNVSSFREFQESVLDAWDVKEDEFNKVHLSNSKQTLDSSAYCNLSTNNDHSIKVQPEIFSSKNSKSVQKEHLNMQMSKGFYLHLSDQNQKEVLFSKSLKFKSLLESPLLCMDNLRDLSWSGIPNKQRPVVWKILSGFVPTAERRRTVMVERKREEYSNLVNQYFNVDRDKVQEKIFRQIHIDIPRMSSMITLFKQEKVQKIFERILFIWAVRHPASGYVQGMNDLVTPFFIVFLEEFLPLNSDPNSVEVTLIPKEHLDLVEADCFWCFSKFVEGIQDNYISSQYGVQVKVKQLKELIQRVDSKLHKHLESHEINYLHFSYRWMNNVLTREVPFDCCKRLWDTYLAEIENLATFQLYVSAAFLLHWRNNLLLKQDFQGLILLLQNLPTQNWTESDISVLVAEAYKLQFMFADSPSHLQNN